MKSIVLKILLTVNLFFMDNYKAQAVNDYMIFYNGIAPKLNSIASNKTQFYGQNFSNFYSELQNKNIKVVMVDYDTKTDPGTKYYVLRLYFSDMNMWEVASKNSFKYPWVSIVFENEIPKQIENVLSQSNMKWSDAVQQFFANMKIENIKFISMNGYDSSDKTVK